MCNTNETRKAGGRGLTMALVAASALCIGIVGAWVGTAALTSSEAGRAPTAAPALRLPDPVSEQTAPTDAPAATAPQVMYVTPTAAPTPVPVPPPPTPSAAPTEDSEALAWTPGDCIWARATMQLDWNLDLIASRDPAKTGEEQRYYGLWAHLWEVGLGKITGYCDQGQPAVQQFPASQCNEWVFALTAAHNKHDSGSAWDQEWQGNYDRFIRLWESFPCPPGPMEPWIYYTVYAVTG